MLFCHQIHYIFMINALLSRNFVVPIYALFPPIFLCSKVDHRQFMRFLDVCVETEETVETMKTAETVQTVETEDPKKYDSLTDNLKARDASASKKLLH